MATGVVLAGGGSSRMGKSKAALMIGEEPLLLRTTTRLARAGLPVVVVGPDEVGSLVPDVTVVSDLHPGLGPLAGLEAALAAIDDEWAFVVACDMPFIQPPLVAHMLSRGSDEDVDVVTLRTSHGLEHLHALYSTRCLATIRQHLAARDLSLRSLFADLRLREVSAAEAQPFDPRAVSAFNANSPDEWRQALALAASEPAL